MRLRVLVLPITAVLLVGIWRLRNPQQLDELYWIGGACYASELVTAGRLMDDSWTLLPLREHPQFGRIVLGAALRGTGGCEGGLQLVREHDLLFIDALNNLVSPLPDHAAGVLAEQKALANEGLKHAKREGDSVVCAVDRPLLVRARLITLLLGALAACATCAFGVRIGGSLVGSIAGLLFALQPAAVAGYTMVFMDIPGQALGSLALLIVLARVVRASGNAASKQSAHEQLLWDVAAASLLAFALGTKLSTASFALALAVVGALACTGSLTGDRRSDRLTASRLLRIFGMAGILFLVSNPLLFSHPLSGLRGFYTVHREVIEIQRRMPLGPGGPAGVTAQYLTSIGSRISSAMQLSFGIAAGLLTSLYLAAALCWRSSPVVKMLACWWCAAVVVVGLTMPFAWQRYALPLVQPEAVCLALVVNELVSELRRRKAPRSCSS
jgi:hypothetical protein